MANQTQQTTQTTQQHNDATRRVHPDFASVESTDGVAFSKGNMLVNGAPQLPDVVQDWESTNGTTVYTTVQWRDPATGEKRVSCNCPGWAILRRGSLRQCKHTHDMMGMGTADAVKVNKRKQIRSVEEAEERVPKFSGRAVRAIQLDYTPRAE